MNEQIFNRLKPSSVSAVFRLSLFSVLILSAFLLSGCSQDPIFSSIEKEVELKDPSVVGNSITSLITYNGNVYVSNGYIFRRIGGTGDWHNVSLPSGADHCAGLACDGTNLYALFMDDDWTTFNSVQRYDGAFWTKVTGLTDVLAIGSGKGRIYAFKASAASGFDDVYVTQSAGAIAFNTTSIATVDTGDTNIPVGCAGDYFATKLAVYYYNGSSVTPLTATGSPTSFIDQTIAGIALDTINGSDHLYVSGSGYAYHYNITSDTWTARISLNLSSTPATGVAVLDTIGKTSNKLLLLVSCDEGYGEVTISATDGSFGFFMSPGSKSISSIRTNDKDQYESTLELWHLSSIFAETSAVPFGNDYVVYAGVKHYKYNGLWGYYNVTQTEWNRE